MSKALLTRIDELVRSPTLVPLIDHYLDRLLDAPPVSPLWHSGGKSVARDKATGRW